MATRTAYVGTQSVGDVLTSANFSKLPGGWIGYAEVTANQGSITTVTDLTSLTLTVTVNTSRKVRVSGKIEVSSTVADGAASFFIRNGSSTQLQRTTVPITTTSSYTMPIDYYTNPTGGSNTYKLSLERTSGTGTYTMGASATSPAFIVVDDVGPSS